MRGIAGHDREPGVQEVVTLLKEGSVVPGKAFDGVGRPGLGARRVAIDDDDRHRAAAKDLAVHVERGQALAELPHRGRGRVIDEHLAGRGLRTDVVDERDAAVEVVALAGADVATHAAGRQHLPFQAGHERRRERRQIIEQAGKRARRRLLHRQHLDRVAVHDEAIAVAVHGRVGGVEVEVRVVFQPDAFDLVRRVVDEPSEKGERLLLAEPHRPNRVGQLRDERLGPVLEMPDGQGELFGERG